MSHNSFLKRYLRPRMRKTMQENGVCGVKVGPEVSGAGA